MSAAPSPNQPDGADGSTTGPDGGGPGGLHRLPPVEVVEHLGASLAAAGVPMQSARVFAALLVTDDGRLTAAELAQVLEVSPAAVSGAVRHLTTVRWIRRERERGSRRDLYVVLDDAWHDAMMQTEQLYAPILGALTAAHDDVGAQTRAGRRLGASVEFLEFVVEEMRGVTARWEARRAGRTG